MARVRPAAEEGRRSRSLPTATIPLSIRWIVDAIVNSRTGPAGAPPRTSIHPAPTEKSPLTGLTPECTPEIDWIRTPSPIRARISSGDSDPGTTDRARAPVPGPLLNPARTADAVDTVPARRAAYVSYRNR